MAKSNKEKTANVAVNELESQPKESSQRRGRRRSRREATRSQASDQQQVARKDRPTPARREAGRGNVVTRTLRPVIDYFTSTRAELQKVTWPTREESLRLAGIVLAVTVISSIALGILDYLYGELFRLGFNAPIIFVIAGVILAILIGSGLFWLRRRRSL